MPNCLYLGIFEKKEEISMSKAAKKRGGKIFLTVICIIFAALLVVGYIFREEIYIAISAITSSDEAIESQKAENDKKTQELLDKLSDVTMRDLTEEERKMLESGLLSEEEALKLIMGETPAPETTVPAPETTDLPDETAETTEAEVTEAVVTEATTAATTVATTETSAAPDAEKIAALSNRKNEIIAEIYLLRATYLNKIDELIKNSKAEYVALPKEKHNMSGKLEMVEKVIIPKGNALEAECDLKMDALLLELDEVLEGLGEDKSLITEVENAYIEQKRLKKTELINTYMPK